MRGNGRYLLLVWENPDTRASERLKGRISKFSQRQSGIVLAHVLAAGFHPGGMIDFSRWLRARQRPAPPENMMEKTPHPGGMPDAVASFAGTRVHLASLRDAIDFFH